MVRSYLHNFFDGTVRAVAGGLPAVLRVACFIAAQVKYLCRFRDWLFVYVSLHVCKPTHDTGEIHTIPKGSD